LSTGRDRPRRAWRLRRYPSARGAVFVGSDRLRRQRDAGAYEALKAVKRGPERAPANPLAAGHAQLARDNKRLTLQLRRAEAVIDIQKK
jgi:hypothetical protein